jgi:hypothetical protein
VLADVPILKLLIEPVQLLELHKVRLPEPLVLRAIVSVLPGFEGLPLASCDCTMICVEQLPTPTVTGEVVNTNWVAGPAITVSVPAT